jgi:hypothetical protein
MTTYKRTDGGYIAGEYEWVGAPDYLDAEAEDEPVEFVEEVWVRESARTFTLPTCRECDETATHWGLCEKHARQDDPSYFHFEGGEGDA